METAPRNCRFLSLVVVELALIQKNHENGLKVQGAARGGRQKEFDHFLLVFGTLSLEEDKRATTNVQNGLVFFFLFS